MLSRPRPGTRRAGGPTPDPRPGVQDRHRRRRQPPFRRCRARGPPWVAITPVVNAIRVLERMVPDGHLLFGHDSHDVRGERPDTVSLKPSALRERIEDFINWANREAARHGLPGQAIPADRASRPGPLPTEPGLAYRAPAQRPGSPGHPVRAHAHRARPVGHRGIRLPPARGRAVKALLIPVDGPPREVDLATRGSSAPSRRSSARSAPSGSRSPAAGKPGWTKTARPRESRSTMPPPWSRAPSASSSASSGRSSSSEWTRTRRSRRPYRQPRPGPSSRRSGHRRPDVCLVKMAVGWCILADCGCTAALMAVGQNQWTTARLRGNPWAHAIPSPVTI